MIRDFSQFLDESEKAEQMELPSSVIRISDLYSAAGKKLYVVGGAVRDFLQHKTPKDIDLATDALPEESLKILRPIFQTKEVGKAFGVVIAITHDDEYEIATFREDEGSGRRPTGVKFSTIEKDVLRRDLTINAMFYDIQKGKIVDLVGGREDLKNKNVRTVGIPAERFKEDALRKLRAVRFAMRLGGTLDADTYAALKKDPSLPEVSGERIHNEFMNILKTAVNKKKAIKLLDELGFFPHIFPDLEITTDKVALSSPIANLGLLLRTNDPDKIISQLKKLNYEVPEASAVSFLLRLKKLNIENGYQLKKFQERSSLKGDISILREFGQQVISKQWLACFIAYTITTSGEDLEHKGFKADQIGKEMYRIESEIWAKLVKKTFEE